MSIMRSYEETKADSDRLVNEAKANLALEYMERTIELLNTPRPDFAPPRSPERQEELDRAILAWQAEPHLFYDDWQAAQRVGTKDFVTRQWLTWQQMTPRQRALSLAWQRTSIMRRDLL